MNGQQNRVARNIIALLVNQLGTWTVTFVLILVVPKYLGLHVFGLYSFVGTFVGFFALGMNLGTSTYLTWRIAREPEEAGKLTFNTLMLQIPLGIAVGVLTLTALPLFDKHPFVMKLALLMLLSTVISSLTATCAAAMSGLQRMRTPATLNVIGSMLGAALVLVCVQLHLDVVALSAVGVLAQLVTFIATLIYTQIRIRMHLWVNVKLWPKIIAGGLPFFLWSVVLMWYWQIDIPLLKILCGAQGDDVVGWYAAANKIIGIPVFLPNIVVMALMPALSHERSADSPTFRSLVSRGLRLVALVNVPAAIGTTMLAGSLTTLLHYPPAFDRVSELIVILAWNMPLVAVDMVLGTVLVALGRQKAWAVVGIVAGMLNPLVNLWAIPYAQQMWGNGAIAASLTTIMSEVIMFMGALYLSPKAIISRGDVWYIVRCALAGAAMVPAIWALSSQPHINILIAVGYGLLLYAAAAYTLQLIRNEDVNKVLEIIGAKTGIESAESLRGLIRTASRPLVFAGGVISRPLVRVGTVVSEPLGRARRRITGSMLSAAEADELHAGQFPPFSPEAEPVYHFAHEQADAYAVQSASSASMHVAPSDDAYHSNGFAAHDQLAHPVREAPRWTTGEYGTYSSPPGGHASSSGLDTAGEDTQRLERSSLPAPSQEDWVTSPLTSQRRSVSSARRARHSRG